MHVPPHDADAEAAAPVTHAGPAVPLRDLVEDPALGLSVAACPDRLDTQVRWAHVSELAAPAPYLFGGELLLTAGVDLPPDLDAYVAELAGAGVSALGFGVAPVHRTVPPALVTACERYGLPLVVVPEQTPFLAVSRTVAEALGRQHLDQLHGLAEAQGRLTEAALHTDRPLLAVVTAAARALGGWARLLDAEGAAGLASPGAPPLPARVRELARRLSERSGPRSATDHSQDSYVVLYPLDASHAGARVLVLGRGHAFTPADRGIMTVCVGLLGLLSRAERTAGDQGALAALLLLGEHADAMRPRTSALLDALLAGGGGGADVRALRARRVPAGPDSAPDASEIARILATSLFDADGDHLRGVVPAHVGQEHLETLRERTGWLGSLSRPVPPERLPAADAETRRLLDEALRTGTPVAVAVAGPGIGEVVDREAAREWAQRTLRPLRTGQDSGEPVPLAELLRVWLTHHGSWDRTAQATGLHRNSVRHRVQRIERLLDVDLADPGVRANLWLALTWSES